MRKKAARAFCLRGLFCGYAVELCRKFGESDFFKFVFKGALRVGEA